MPVRSCYLPILPTALNPFHLPFPSTCPFFYFLFQLFLLFSPFDALHFSSRSAHPQSLIHPLMPPLLPVALIAISQLNMGGSISTLSGTTLFYNGSEAAFNATFSEFLRIPTNSVTLGSMSYNDITKVLPPGNERTNGQLMGLPSFLISLLLCFFISPSLTELNCRQYGGSALYPHHGHFQRAFTHWTNFTNTFINELFLSTIAWTPVPQSQIDISNMNGGTAFAPPDGMFCLY